MPSTPKTLQAVARTITLAALAACALSAHADFTVYTDQASFLAATSNTATDNFDDVSLGYVPGPLDRSAGSYGYTASVQDGFNGAFYGLDSGNGGVWLSQLNMAPITFDTFTTDVQAIGGYFFATDFNGAYAAGEQLTVTATDQFGSITQTLVDASPTNFLGFLSTGNFASLSFGVVDNGLNNAFATTDDLSFGQPALIPEPSTYALMLAGLGVVAVMARRRRPD